MKKCLSCDTPLVSGALVCQVCGADTSTLWNDEVQPTAAVAPHLHQKAEQTEMYVFVGGFLTALIISCVGLIFMIGTIISIIVYAATKRSYPTFARGIGWGILAGIFGATFLCGRAFGVFSYLHH